MEEREALTVRFPTGLLSPEEALGCFDNFCQLPIDYVDTNQLRARTWEIAEQYQMPSLYDAAFLVCAESLAWAVSSGLLTNYC